MTQPAPFRFMSWNVNWASTAERRARRPEVIRRLRPDVLALQEVSASTLTPLAAEFAWNVFAVAQDPAERYRGQQLGTALLGSARTAPVASMTVAPYAFQMPPDAPSHGVARFGKRALGTEILLDGIASFLAGSFHATPATDRDLKRHKSWFHAGVARWLAQLNRPWVMGIDANTPAVDHPDAHRTEFCWPATLDRPGEEELLGTGVAHRGIDVLRSYLEEHPKERARITSLRPDGPLAISHRLGANGVRYDHVLATREFQVMDVRYVDVFEVSDHAAVVVDLALGP